MASRIRAQVAKQLADAVHRVSGSPSPDVGRVSWCVRCASAARKNESATHHLIVPYKHLKSCRVIPPDLPWQQQLDLAHKIKNEMKCVDGVRNVEAHNNNFVVEYDPFEFTKGVLEDVASSKDNYGRNSVLHRYRKTENDELEEQPQGQTVLVEYSSPNIAKPFHAGHLRSTIIGNFVANINEALSHHAVRINYLGDWGTQFGLLGVGYQKYGSHQAMTTDAMQHLFDVYVKINRDAKDSNSDETHKAGMAFFKRMEEGDASAMALWQYCKDSSIVEYSKVYERLGVHFDHYEGESQYQAECRELVDALRERGLLQYRSDAPVGYVDLSTEDTPGLHAVIQKSDGTTLYISRDIAAAIDRHKRFEFDRAHYVVEKGQDLHFQQLVGVLKRLDYDWAHKCAADWHVPFGRVQGMSTRRGEVVFLKDILDEAQACMLDNMENTETTTVTENLESVADRLGVSAVIIQDLKEPRLRNYKFSWKRALTFQGDTGVSLQYTHARLCGLERNSGAQINPECDMRLLTEPCASAVTQHLARFDECLQESFLDVQAHYLTSYLFQLKRLVNLANKELQVKGQPRDIAEARLFLFHCARLTLANGLKILGVTPLQRM